MEAIITALTTSTITTLKAATDHYDVVKDDKDLLEAFHEAGRGLLLVEQALQAAQRNSAKEPQSARDPLWACNTKANSSASIFKAVAEAPETSRFKVYEAAVRQEGNGQTVEVLVVGMMNDVCALAIQDQVKGLREAIEKMQPSLPKEGSGHAFTHYGTGDQLNAPGGTVNHSKGNGTHFPGAAFHGSVSFGSPSPQNPPTEHPQ